jgi:hypothetical protein
MAELFDCVERTNNQTIQPLNNQPTRLPDNQQTFLLKHFEAPPEML